MEIKRGDIYYADLNPTVGCEQGGIRPVLIIQNNTGNHSCIHQHVFLLNTDTHTALRDLRLIACCRQQQPDVLQKCTHSSWLCSCHSPHG